MTASVPYIRPYPTHAFKGLLGAMLNCLTGSGIATELVGTQLIAFASLLTQGGADVVWPNGMKSPIGNSCLLVAPSGSGKTVIFKLLMTLIDGYLTELIKRNSLAKLPIFFLEDATREAIVKSLHDWPIAALFTDEAGQLKGLFKYSPTLVKLLDASTLRNARISTGRVELVGYRFCALWMEQPDVFTETKAQMGVGKGGVGLINRLFVVQTSGAVDSGSLHQVCLSDSVNQEYDKKIRELLGLAIKHVEQDIERPALRLSPEASCYLISLEDEVRRNREPGSPFFFISEYLSRHVERVLRLAGVLHVFEYGADGDISFDTIQQAATLGNWYVDSYAQIAHEPPKQTQAEVDALALEQAMRQSFYATGSSCFLKSRIHTSSVNLGLTPNRLTRALAILGGQRKVRVFMHGKTSWVELNTFNFSL